MINEVPTVLMIGIVILVIVKPFLSPSLRPRPCHAGNGCGS